MSDVQGWAVAVARQAARCYVRVYGNSLSHAPDHWVSVAWERIARECVRDERLALRAGVLACLDAYRIESGCRRRHREFVRPLSLDEPAPVSGEPETLGDSVAAPDRLPDPPVRLAEAWGEARPARAGVKLRDRVWLYLWLVEGWSFAEIAIQWGLTPAAVSHALRAWTLALKGGNQ